MGRVRQSVVVSRHHTTYQYSRKDGFNVARYTDAVCRLCRRENMKLFLKGERCLRDKCAINKRNYAPGQHGQRRAKLSVYVLQLREKQKVKRKNGVGDSQFWH